MTEMSKRIVESEFKAIQCIIDFSPKFYCIKTVDKRYCLISKTQFKNISQLKFISNPLVSESRPRTSSALFDNSFLLNRYNTLLAILVMICVCLGVYYLSIPVAVLLISLFLHELGHVVVAYIIGCRELMFGFRLQYRAIPILYISNRDLYECGYFSRLAYYSGGVIVNFAIVFISWLVLSFINDGGILCDIVSYFLVINLALGIINLCPLLFTDGFNILRELIQVYDLRIVILSNIYKPKIIFSKGYKYGLYYVFLICTFIFLIIRIGL